MSKIIQIVNVPDTDNFQGYLMGLDDTGNLWGFQNGKWDFVSCSPNYVSPKSLIVAGNKLEKLITDLQTECVNYLPGDGTGVDEFINNIVGILDGSEQRAAQTLWRSVKIASQL